MICSRRFQQPIMRSYTSDGEYSWKHTRMRVDEKIVGVELRW